MGIYQYFGNLKVSCSRTLYGGRGVRTLDLSLRSPNHTKVIHNTNIVYNKNITYKPGVLFMGHRQTQ